MIFSLLNLRKKTAAVIAGISIGAMCLWGLAIWQDISTRELFNMFLAVTVMILVIIIIAIAFIALIKMLWMLVKKLKGGEEQTSRQDGE
ncbi:MAG: hypothetical protein RL120_02480 [Gammaproteobacteria bacterium]